MFAQVEAAALLPAPEQPYRVPAWSEAKVQRDFHLFDADAFYSVPYRLAGSISVPTHLRSTTAASDPHPPAARRRPASERRLPARHRRLRPPRSGKLPRCRRPREAIGSTPRDLGHPAAVTRSGVYALIGWPAPTAATRRAGRAAALDWTDRRRQDQVNRGEGTGKQAAQAAARSRRPATPPRLTAARSPRYRESPPLPASAAGPPGGRSDGAAAPDSPPAACLSHSCQPMHACAHPFLRRPGTAAGRTAR